MPRVACVMPCHSYPKYTRAAIASVRQQQVQFDWLIPVVDGPPPEIEAQYRQMFEQEQMDAVFLEENRGVAHARNLAIDTARDLGADWFVNLDEDDVLNPRFLERSLQAAESAPWVGVWYTDWSLFQGEQGYRRTPPYDPGRLRDGPFILSTALISIEVWNRVKDKNGAGYDEGLEQQGLRWEDYLFYLEASMLKPPVPMARIQYSALVHVRRHGESGTSRANRTINEWRAYAGEKLERLYGERPWTSPATSNIYFRRPGKAASTSSPATGST